MVGDQRHLHDPAAAEKFARALGLMVGGHHPFVGDWKVKGLYAYRSGKYKGQAYFGTGGSESDRLKDIYNPINPCLLYTSPSPRDEKVSRMPSSA